MKNFKLGSIASALSFTDRAIYSPATFASFAQGLVKPLSPPAAIAMDDLNVVNPYSKYFTLPLALTSAGVADISPTPKACIFTQRDRSKANSTISMGDSGGHQIANGTIILNESVVEDIFYYQTGTCDIGHTLDIPTAPMYDQKKNGEIYSRPTFDSCLFETVKYQEVFKSLGAENHKFLNVLQGRGIHDTDLWYDTVKCYNHFGWSFADIQSNSLQLTIWRILRLIEDGMFDRDATWLHFLGVGDLKTSLILTTILRMLREWFDGKCEINISYDTKTPFLQAINLNYMAAPNITANQFGCAWERIDSNKWQGNASDKFPNSATSVGKRLTKGDLIYNNWQAAPDIDEIRTLILSHHNLEMTFLSIDAAHSALDSGQNDKIPQPLLKAIDAIKLVLGTKDVTAAKRRLLDRKYLKPLNNAYKNN